MAVDTHARPRAQSGGGLMPLWRRWWPWTPLLLAGVYLVLLLVQFPQVVAATYLNADSASAPVIGSLAGHGNGLIVLGDMPWYSVLLFELGTRWLPLHRDLWEVVPYAMTLASVGLIAWALWRVAGRWAALVAAAVLLCASPPLLLLLFSLDDHSPTWFTLALLGAWTVALQHVELPRRRWAPSLAVAVGVLVAVIAGCNAASDRLAVIGGLVPLALSGLAAWYWRPSARSRMGAVAALATVALAALVAVVVTHEMRSHGVIYAANIAFGSQARVQANLTLWWQSLAYLGNGNFFGAPLDLTGALAAACAIVVLLATAVALRVGWLELGSQQQQPALQRQDGRGSSARAELGAAHGGAPTAASAPAAKDAARIAHVAFWASAGLLLTVAYVLSSAPVDLTSSRYLVGVLYAAVVLTVLLVEHRPKLRGVVVAGALVYCFAGVVGMAKGTATENPGRLPGSKIANAVASIAAREHLTRGYAGYWDAAPITWASHLRVDVYPVFLCPAGLCQFYLHTIAGWYRPHPGQRTFLLTDPTQLFLQSLPPGLGKPSATYRIGQVTMYVYPYDIASRISPP
jgi:hypothetical protein